MVDVVGLKLEFWRKQTIYPNLLPNHLLFKFWKKSLTSFLIEAFNQPLRIFFSPTGSFFNNLPTYTNNIYFGCFALFSYFKTFSCSQGRWIGGWFENPILMKAKSSNQTWTKGLSKMILKNGRSLVKPFWFIKNTGESFVVILRLLNSL